jgi:uncharacterized membrane protein
MPTIGAPELIICGIPLLIIGGIAWLIIWLSNRSSPKPVTFMHPTKDMERKPDAIAALDMRLARGEITESDYHRLRAVIEKGMTETP